MTVTIQPIDKVLIYATWNDRLLVFEEPDFPETPLQVPGARSMREKTFSPPPIANSPRKPASSMTMA